MRLMRLNMNIEALELLAYVYLLSHRFVDHYVAKIHRGSRTRVATHEKGRPGVIAVLIQNNWDTRK